jgi:hypothetical protein
MTAHTITITITTRRMISDRIRCRDAIASQNSASIEGAKAAVVKVVQMAPYPVDHGTTKDSLGKQDVCVLRANTAKLNKFENTNPMFRVHTTIEIQIYRNTKWHANGYCH